MESRACAVLRLADRFITPSPASMKIVLAQINPSIGDLEGNRELILDYARRAYNRGTDLVACTEPHSSILR